MVCTGYDYFIIICCSCCDYSINDSLYWNDILWLASTSLCHSDILKKLKNRYNQARVQRNSTVLIHVNMQRLQQTCISKCKGVGMWPDHQRFWIFVKLVFRDDNIQNLQRHVSTKQKNCKTWRISWPQVVIRLFAHPLNTFSATKIQLSFR